MLKYALRSNSLEIAGFGSLGGVKLNVCSCSPWLKGDMDKFHISGDLPPEEHFSWRCWRAELAQSSVHKQRLGPTTGLPLSCGMNLLTEMSLHFSRNMLSLYFSACWAKMLAASWPDPSYWVPPGYKLGSNVQAHVCAHAQLNTLDNSVKQQARAEGII